jgi:hypothetical protein
MHGNGKRRRELLEPVLAGKRRSVDLLDKRVEADPSRLRKAIPKSRVRVVHINLGVADQRILDASQDDNVFEPGFTVVSRDPDRSIKFQFLGDVVRIEKSFVCTRGKSQDCAAPGKLRIEDSSFPHQGIVWKRVSC